MVQYVSDTAAQAAHPPWWSPIEALDADALRALQTARLRAQFAYLLAHSPYPILCRTNTADHSYTL